ncbi:MAG: TolC family protein [Kiritimatiellae bacterium]|nr:TolC family protein [Kiritimatiellia bacterium]
MTVAACWISVAMAAAMPAGALTLEECIRAALEHNPDAAAAEERVIAARAALRQARSAGWPMVGVSAQHARTDNPPQAFMMALNQRALDMRDPAFDPNDPDDTGNTRLSIGLKWRLLDFGRRAAGVEAAAAMARAREAAAEAVRNQLAYEVTRAWYGALQAREFERVQTAQVASLEESLRIAREREARGAAIRGDVLSIEVRLSEAREDLVRARNAVSLAIAALNTAIGRDLASPERLPERGEVTVEPEGELRDDLPLEDHPAARAVAAAADARRAAARRARAEFRPTLSAFASSDWDAEDVDGFERSYLAGVVAELDLFDGFRRRGAVEEAAAEVRAADAEARRTMDQLRFELRQAVIRAREAAERLKVVTRAASAADEALRIARARYEQGAADLAELLNAEVAQASIRSRHVAALYDHRIALANVERAQGRLAAAFAARGGAR